MYFALGERLDFRRNSHDIRLQLARLGAREVRLTGGYHLTHQENCRYEGGASQGEDPGYPNEFHTNSCLQTTVGTSHALISPKPCQDFQSRKPRRASFIAGHFNKCNSAAMSAHSCSIKDCFDEKGAFQWRRASRRSANACWSSPARAATHGR